MAYGQSTGLDSIATDGIDTSKGLFQTRSDDELGLGVWGHAKDIAKSPFRGVVGASQEIYNLVDWITQDDLLPDSGDWKDALNLGHSKTIAGTLIEGISQFSTGFIPVFMTLGVVGKAAKLGAIGTRVAKAASTAKKAGKLKTSKAIAFGGEFGKSTLAGAVADFSVFDPHEARLSDLLLKFPALRNPITEFLSADPDDTELEGRLKNLLEGAAIGGLIEPFIMGLRALRLWRKGKQNDTPIQETMETIQADRDARIKAQKEELPQQPDDDGKLVEKLEEFADEYDKADENLENNVPLLDDINRANKDANDAVAAKTMDEVQREVDEAHEASRGESEMPDDEYFSSPPDENELRRFEEESNAIPQEFVSKKMWKSTRRGEVKASLASRGVPGDLAKENLNFLDSMVREGNDIRVDENGYVLLWHRTTGHYAKQIRERGYIPTDYKPPMIGSKTEDGVPLWDLTHQKPRIIGHYPGRSREGVRTWPTNEHDAVIRTWVPLEYIVPPKSDIHQVTIKTASLKGDKLKILPASVQGTRDSVSRTSEQVARIVKRATKESPTSKPRPRTPESAALRKFQKIHEAANPGMTFERHREALLGAMGRKNADEYSKLEKAARKAETSESPRKPQDQTSSKTKSESEQEEIWRQLGEEENRIKARLEEEIKFEEQRTGVDRDALDMTGPVKRSPGGRVHTSFGKEQLRQLRLLDPKTTPERARYERTLQVVEERGLQAEVAPGTPGGDRLERWRKAADESDGGKGRGTIDEGGSGKGDGGADEGRGDGGPDEGRGDGGPDEGRGDGGPDEGRGDGGPDEGEGRVPTGEELIRGEGPRVDEGSAVFKWRNFVKESRLAIKLIVKSSPEEIRELLSKEGYERLSSEELRAEVRVLAEKSTAQNREMGIKGPFGGVDVEKLIIHPQVRQIAAMQNYVRALVQHYADLSKSLYYKASTGSDTDKAAFYIVSMMADTVNVIN